MSDMAEEIKRAHKEGGDVKDKLNRFMDVVEEIAAYGQEHWDDPNLRDAPKDNVFTNHFIKKIPNRIQRNKIQRA